MAEMLGSALVQEAVSRCVSFGFSRSEEKASQGHLKERLEMAVSELEFALERSEELPIRHLSLVGRRKIFKRAYVEAMELLDKHWQQEVPAAQEEQVAQGVKRKRWILCATNKSIIPSAACLSTDDVRRFEWYADHAAKFVRDVESGCSLHHYTFFSHPIIVRHLLEGKTITYSLKQGNVLRDIFIWPAYHCAERGVGAVLGYCYEDSTMVEKCFTLLLSLRLSESTDIVGVATKCLHLLTSSEFKPVAQFATGELTLLNTLQAVALSHGRPYTGVDIQGWYVDDPTCCKGRRHGLYPNKDISSELAHIFPEQDVSVGFCCYISAPDPSCSRNSSSRGWTPRVKVMAEFSPHVASYIVPTFIGIRQLHTKSCNSTCAVERIGKNDDKCKDNVSLEQVAETVKPNAINNCFSHLSEVTEYEIEWCSKHGSALTTVKKASMERTVGAPKTRTRYNTRGSTRRSILLDRHLY